jgi:uncharacterized membrane protein
MLVFTSTFGTISRNHLWKGAEASFVRMAAVPAINNNFVPLICRGAARYITITAEAVDWMIKYFMEASVRFFLWLVLVTINIQKESVFISKATHTSTHEFLESTTRLLRKSVAIIIGRASISISYTTLNCKFKDRVDIHILLEIPGPDLQKYVFDVVL